MKKKKNSERNPNLCRSGRSNKDSIEPVTILDSQIHDQNITK